jgi:4-amino-4-deoxy-L-arabinose transferase-like glycosyltransferase
MSFSVFKSHNYRLKILLLGGLLRVLWAIAVPVMPVSDSFAYDTFARNLANCHNYGWTCNEPSAFWPVGTSFIYSLFYSVFGHSYIPIVVLNILLGVLSIGLTMHLAKTWFGPRVAAISGLLLALWPSQIQFTTVLASEQLFTALTLAALVFWDSEALNLWLRSGIVGAVLAAASYVRPTASLIPAVFLFSRYWKTREIRRSLLATLVTFAVIAGLAAPWSIRNTQVFGQFVTFSTNGGANLWMGNNPASNGGYMDLPPEVANMNEAQRDKYLKSLAIAHIKENPWLFVARAAQRTLDTHSRESIGVVWNEAGLTTRYGHWILLPLKIVNQLYWLAMLGLGLLGLGLLGYQSGWLTILTHPVVLMWGYFTVIHAVIVAQDRYHFPSIPMIAVLAALTLCWFYKIIRRDDSSKLLLKRYS